MSASPESALRLTQLDTLSRTEINGSPILMHGSIGHAALMGEPLPSATKANGSMRDIDIFLEGGEKFTLEDQLGAMGLQTPHPIDAGMCNLLVREGSSVIAKKGAVAVELNDTGIFDEVTAYEVLESNGVVIKSLRPAGQLALHLLEPAGNGLRINHLPNDLKYLNWHRNNGTEIPQELKSSIEEFHRAYKEAYPYGGIYHQLAGIYIKVIPETIRKHLRQHTHRFMRVHAGRKTPYSE